MHQVRLAKRAERGLRRIREVDRRGYERIRSAIETLADQPRPEGIVKLSGFEPPAWRLRVGEYRIVYEICDDELVVVVINVAPRGEVYRYLERKSVVDLVTSLLFRRGSAFGMTGQRTFALVLLLVAGILSLPVAAYFFDSPGTENWVVPVQLISMALIGALVGRLLPGLAGSGQSTGWAMLVGAVVGVLMALVGIVIFFLLLNGFSGA